MWRETIFILKFTASRLFSFLLSPSPSLWNLSPGSTRNPIVFHPVKSVIQICAIFPSFTSLNKTKKRPTRNQDTRFRTELSFIVFFRLLCCLSLSAVISSPDDWLSCLSSLSGFFWCYGILLCMFILTESIPPAPDQQHVCAHTHTQAQIPLNCCLFHFLLFPMVCVTSWELLTVIEWGPTFQGSISSPTCSVFQVPLGPVFPFEFEPGMFSSWFCPGCSGTEPSTTLSLVIFVLFRPMISLFVRMSLFCHTLSSSHFLIVACALWCGRKEDGLSEHEFA